MPPWVQSLWGGMAEMAVWRVRPPREVLEEWAAKGGAAATLAMADRAAQGATPISTAMVVTAAEVAMEQRVLQAASVPQVRQDHSVAKALRLQAGGTQNSS
ncbi:hypothetical protein ERHA55_11910 [Erwinia rhapontici]|nr:hypothetical protein ERHA55_11910 [Erwinia rhapontici]